MIKNLGKLKPDKLRSLALYSLRSLTHYNGTKLTESEREFSDTKSRVNREAVKQYGFCIPSKPRSLRYYFVADLCKPGSSDEGAAYEKIMADVDSSASLLLVDSSLMSFESSSDAELVKDASNLFSKVS